MPRLSRRTVILAKLETTSGTPIATANTDAILIANPNFEMVYNNVKRDVLTSYLGASEELVGTRYCVATFDVELAGSGDVEAPKPAWGKLLEACGFTFSVTDVAGTGGTTADDNFVTYSPDATLAKSLTINYYNDGVRHQMVGCRGTATLKLLLNEKPVISFRFAGIDNGQTSPGNAAATLTAFKVPLAVRSDVAGDMIWGGTYPSSPATTALAVVSLGTGTRYPNRGITIDLGVTAEHTPLLNVGTGTSETIEITNREVTGKVDLLLDVAADEVTFMAAIDAVTTTSLGFTFGTAPGNTIILWMPRVQRTNPRFIDYNGRRMLSMDLRMLPTNGDDELKIVVK